MSKSRIAAAAIAAMLMPGSAALAADMPMGLPTPPVIAPDADLFGWYLRGDLGYRLQSAGSVASAGAVSTNNRIDDAFAVGLGIGYKWWSWFRIDLTADYAFAGDYKGDTLAAAPDFTAKVRSTTLLANAYVDLGTWSGFTPYLGAGVGGAYVETTDFGSASLPASTVSSSRWNVAWAAMAGFSYAFSQNLLVDIGYRYLNQGQVKTGITGPGDQLTFKDLTAHEIRAGFRWAM
jgi:opacity protein-like surface antigen